MCKKEEGARKGERMEERGRNHQGIEKMRT